MIIISKEQIINLHKQLIDETGGSHGLRDEGLPDSACNAPFQRFDNQELFPTIQQKSARLAYGLIKNHPFVDGNKRIGTHVMLILLALNGIELNYTQEELYTIILEIASGTAELNKLTEWILNHQL
ncbi:MAG: type II toxin-antitoxin system death-on-curing family toxin [Ruminococcus sp.]|nr:type II toxin-antitoxin system death-on-curing family toxin [Ruminococcus sp.]